VQYVFILSSRNDDCRRRGPALRSESSVDGIAGTLLDLSQQELPLHEIPGRRMTTSVSLVKALGGGWEASALR